MGTWVVKIGGGGGEGNREETKDQFAILDQGVRVIAVGRKGEVRYLKVKDMYIYIEYGIKINLALGGRHPSVGTVCGNFYVYLLKGYIS